LDASASRRTVSVSPSSYTSLNCQPHACQTRRKARTHACTRTFPEPWLYPATVAA
jgi:hypothetical protein